jgi:hypothetical protein
MAGGTAGAVPSPVSEDIQYEKPRGMRGEEGEQQEGAGESPVVGNSIY